MRRLEDLDPWIVLLFITLLLVGTGFLLASFVPGEGEDCGSASSAMCAAP